MPIESWMTILLAQKIGSATFPIAAGFPLNKGISQPSIEDHHGAMGGCKCLQYPFGMGGWIDKVRSSWAAFSLAAKVVVLGGCHFQGWSYLETYEPRTKDQPVARLRLGTHQVVVWFAQALLCGQHASNARDWATKPEHARCHWWISNLLDGIEWNCNSMAIHFGNGSNSPRWFQTFSPARFEFDPYRIGSWGRKGCWEFGFPFLGCKTCPQKAIV